MPLNRTILTLGLALTAGLLYPATAHETDQFTLPAGREFADIGPHLNNWAYEAIERGVNKANERIVRARKERRSDRAINQLQSPEELVKAVNGAFPDAYSLIEGMESLLHSREMREKYPGLLVGHEEQFGNIFQHVHFPLDPRQFFRIWHASTFKAYGTYLGTDKIGHFVDMGMHYYRAYSSARRDGRDDVEAVRKAVEVGTHGPIFSERGMVGYLSAGAYSNADLAANYLGLLFYLNLTEPIELEGEARPPMVVREGDLWVIAPHVRRDAGFFALFICDHFNEVLNPSHFESSMRHEVHKAIRERTELALERNADQHGNRRNRLYFDRKLEEMRTYFGQEYGYRGPASEMVTVGNTCFETLPIDAGPHDRDFCGQTPLHQAAAAGRVSRIRALLAVGADVNALVRSNERYSSDWGNTPLHFAAREGQLEAAQALLDGYANVNAANHRGQTPLHRAVGDPEMTRLLLDNLANASARDSRGQTPLHWAAADGYAETVKVLLAGGARPFVRDNENQTPLHAAVRARHRDIAELLIERGADTNAVDRLNIAPIHLAAANNDVAMLQLLLDKGGHFGTADEFGLTAVHEAARLGRTEALSLLIDRGADVSVQDGRGNTPLHLAARAGRLEAVALLAKANATLNAQNDCGQTPLHEAVASGRQTIVERLLELKADPSIRDGNGHTPLDIAAARRYYEIATVLRNGRPVAAGAI